MSLLCLIWPLANLLMLIWYVQCAPIKDSLSISPRTTETRQTQSLDGVWNFRLTNNSENGFNSQWFRVSLDEV